MNDKKKSLSRRQFLKKSSVGLATASALPILSNCTLPTDTNQNNSNIIHTEDLPGPSRNKEDPLPRDSNSIKNMFAQRKLGKTELDISLLAFGGGSQFMYSPDGEWQSILERAVEVGVNLFDTAWNYGNGQSEVRFGEVLNNYRDQVYVCTKVDARDSEGSIEQFEGSLLRLKMDYVDILLMHAISAVDDISVIENGVYKELVKFKNEGKAKYIGFSVMLEDDLPVARSLIENLEFDVVLGIINPVNRFGNCSSLLPLVQEKNIGFLSMKAIRNIVSDDVTARELIYYALDKEGVTATVIGHQNLENLEENIEIVNQYPSVSSIGDNWGALERKLEKFADTHTPVWTLPGYHDGMLV
jgi:aryl-alcohol dehydrogenase-like predicted oxidoreductase